LHPWEIFHEAKGPRRREFAAERFTIHRHFHSLGTDLRMSVIDEAMHAEFVRRINPDAPVPIGKFQRFDYVDVAALAAQLARTGLRQQLNERLRRSVQNGKL